jgi:hypothetical protein
MLLCGSYGKGSLYVLTVPDAFADFYNLPPETLNIIRSEFNLPITLECTGRISLFTYDNNTFILQSYIDRPEQVRIRINRPGVTLVPLIRTGIRPFEMARSGENESVFDTRLMPGQYMVFKIEG